MTFNIMLPIEGMWNKIKYSIDIEEIPNGFDVSVNVTGTLCDFTIKDGKMVKFSLPEEVPSYYLLASLIGNAVHMSGYEKVKIPKELVTVVGKKKIKERINVMRVDGQNLEKRKLMDALNEMEIGRLGTYTQPYAYSWGSNDHKYTEGTICAVSKLPEHDEKMNDFMMKDKVKQLKTSKKIKAYAVIGGTFDNHTYTIEKGKKRNFHQVDIHVDGKVAYKYAVRKYTFSKKGKLSVYDGARSAPDYVLLPLLRYSISFLGLKKLKVPGCFCGEYEWISGNSWREGYTELNSLSKKEFEWVKRVVEKNNITPKTTTNKVAPKQTTEKKLEQPISA
jgi:hypothetical protein